MLGIREGETRYFVEKVSSPSAEKFRRGTLLFCVSEIFRYRKSLWIKGGGIKIFRRKNFLSQCRKISQGNLLLLH